MGADALNILAGVGQAELAWFAPLGSTLPTDCTTALASPLVTAGWCTTDGLTANVDETVNTVEGYGTTADLRVIISKSARTFDVTFLETNAVVLAVYNRKALSDVSFAADGTASITQGTPSNTTYAGVFDISDGENHIRYCCPRLQVSSIKGKQIQAGKEIPSGVTLTAIPDASGNSVYEYYKVANLATDSSSSS